MSDAKRKLSVVLATFNEENNIADCIGSFGDIADEIIIYDESSTDKTREIARKLGAQVYKVKHEPIFHVTKNKAIKKAKNDWVLQMDADERLTFRLRQEIKALLAGEKFGFDGWISPLRLRVNKGLKTLGLKPLFATPLSLSKPAAAYFLTRKNLFLDRYLLHCGQYPDPVIRLFQRGRAVLPAKDVHEQMHVSGRVGWLTGDIDHLATPNFSRYLKRENNYSTLKAQELFDQGVKISLFNSLNYLFFKPFYTFVRLYLRYRGFLDGFAGFVFSIYSGFHFAFSYMKLWEMYKDGLKKAK